MNQTNFWLISIDEGIVSASLILLKESSFSIAAIGGQVEWHQEDDTSLLTAVDGSLSQAALKAGLSEDQEPENAAFILPPFWVGSDGKIVADKKKNIENLCKTLNLKPMGFIANDEAVVEEANLRDGFPVSFVLLNLSQSSITISLVYLGKIKERIKKPMPNEFNPSLVESALIELNSESTLPPQILVFGQADDNIINLLKNYPWIGKKDTETFLHFPDINLVSQESVTKIYSSVIASQINPGSLKASVPIPASRLDSEYKTEIEPDSPESEPGPSDDGLDYPPSVDTSEITESFSSFDKPIKLAQEIKEVPPQDLGFSVSDYDKPLDDVKPVQEETLPLINQPVLDTPSETSLDNIPIPQKKKLNLSLPKINFPKLKLPKLKLAGRLVFILPALSPLLLLIPFFFSKADIRLFVTPFEFDYVNNVILDTAAVGFNSSQNIIPAENKTLEFTVSDSVPTTGEKTVGEKAQGEITIYNKQDRNQSLKQGTILIDSDGRNYELVNDVSVASSSSDLDEGVINLGQTKALVIAADIGPEYNLPKDARLTFKEHSDGALIAKATDPFVGGSKRQIKAVSKEDKTALEQRLDSTLTQELDRKVEENLSSLSGLIRDTMQTQKSRIEFNREEGEEAEELSASINATVTVMSINPELKNDLVTAFLSDQDNFKEADINPDNFVVSYEIRKLESDRADATMTIKGHSLPNVDTNRIKLEIKGKSSSHVENVLKSLSRVYNYNIKRNFSFLNFINPFPFRPENINIEVITESL
ncbi:MAG: hypothetical protein ACOX6N_02355 [Patescibacteria group bacterium]|jgi:hypothetical protein